MGALTIHLVRHAPVHPLRQGTVYGPDANIIDVTAADPAVPPDMRQQLVRSFNDLAARLPAGAMLAVSTARRTRQTCDAVRAFQQGAGSTVIRDDSLSEQGWGDWTDLPHARLLQRDPDFSRLHRRGPGWEDIVPPSGRTEYDAESFQQFTARAGRGLDRIVGIPAVQGHEDLVIYTHGGVVRAALMLFGGMDADQAVSQKVPHLSVTRLRHEPAGTPRWQVLEVATV